MPQPVTYGLLLVDELLLATLATTELLEEIEELELLEAAALLLALLDELELAVELDALLEEVVTVGPTEHQAVLVKALPPVNSDRAQVKLPVSVAYTKLPDLPSATEWVPVIVQLDPTWAHFVYPVG